MKKLFIAALAATTLFASCSKEDSNNNNEIAAGEKAKLTIGVTPAPGSRAVGNLTDETDNVVKSFTAYVFRGEVLEAIMTSADGTKVTETAKVTTAANAVYVVANATVTGVVEKSTSKTAFLAKLSDLLSGSSLNVLNGVNGQVWASGGKTITISATTKTLDTSVELTPGPARINLSVTDSRTNKGENGEFVITKVQLLNVVGQMPFIAGQTYTPTWYTGYAGGDNAAAVYNAYCDESYSAGGKHLYYVYENDASAYPTIITLMASNGTDTRYFPVHFTGTNAIARGNSYQVNITLTGKATDDPGIDDPEDEVSLATLGVEVTLKPWSMKTINKEF